jgi:hypothetical protein
VARPREVAVWTIRVFGPAPSHRARGFAVLTTFSCIPNGALRIHNPTKT